jgi:hypothetical protein
MKVDFECVVDGINKYIDKEIYSKLNSVQEFVSRVVVGRINQNADMIKNELMHNGFAKTLGFVDSDGKVDIDEIMQSIKKELERQECIKVDIPLIGSITFKPEDADSLYKEIVGRDDYEDY